MTTTKNSALACVEELNAAWPVGDMATVGSCYHPDAVLLPPDLGPVIQGRDDIVETYATFNSSAALTEFNVTDTECFDFGASTAVHLHFSVAYQLGDQSYNDDGLDIYLLNPHQERWVVVWRQQIVLASHSTT